MADAADSADARLGAGIARASDLRAANAPVGLGVDGAASNEASSAPIQRIAGPMRASKARSGPIANGTSVINEGGPRVARSNIGRHPTATAGSQNTQSRILRPTLTPRRAIRRRTIALARTETEPELKLSRAGQL